MKTTKNSSPVASEYKKPRSVSKKRYSKLEKAYYTAFDDYNLCKTKIEDLLTIISSRQIIVTADKHGGKDKIIDLKQSQILGYRKQLYDAKAKLRVLGSRLSSASKLYRNVSIKNIAATKVKILSMQERRKLALDAERNIDAIRKHVKDLMGKLAKSNSREIALLKTMALQNGLKFHSEFIKMLRKELTDPQIKAMVTASPKTQGVLSKMVRDSYGYIRK